MTKGETRQRWLRLGLIGWCGFLVLLSYSAVLRLPLIADDWNQLPYAASRTVTEIWQGVDSPAFYRPLAYTVWKALYVLLGRHDEIALHALNMALHFFNSLMVGWLAGRLWASSQDEHRLNWRRCYLSAGLFLLFPFSYGGVAWIAAMMHPLVVTLILLSVMSYVRARETGAQRWFVLSLILATLSPFAHENGVLAGPLIIAVELTQPRANLPAAEPAWRRLGRAALWLVPILIWWLSYHLAAAAQVNSMALNDGKTLWRNSVYFLQGPAYPLTWLGTWLSIHLAVDNVLMAVVLSVVALAGAALVQWRSPADRRAWLPWIWIGLASAPTILFLIYRYVSGAPRLLMLMSVGAVWLWTDVVVRLADWGRTTLARRRLLQGTAITLTTVLLIQNVAFIRDRLRTWELGGSAIRQFVEQTLAANAHGQPAVFINLPAWIAPNQDVFPVGQDGAVFMSAYYPLSWIVDAYTGQAGRTASLKNEAIRSEVPYYVGLRDSTTDWPSLVTTGGDIFVTDYAPETVRIRLAGELKIAPLPAQAITRFTQLVELNAASARMTADGLQVELIWRALEPVPDDVTVFVHVLDANGQLIAQADGDPIAGTYPFDQWPKDLIVRDVRSLDVKGSGLSIQVGLYNRSSGERLKATSSEGASFADNAVPIVVH